MATPPEAATQPKRINPKLLIALAAGVSLCTGAALVYFLTGNVLPASASASRQVEQPIFVTLEPLTVNLQTDSKERFLHVGVSLKVRDDQAQTRIVESMPELRSRLLLLLSDRQPGQLSSPADKSRLAEQIRDELNRPLAAGQPAYGIVSVSFNAFVVQ